MHIYRKCKPSFTELSESASQNAMELVNLLSLTALCLMAVTAKADVSEHYLPPGSRPPTGQYLPPSNRPPPPVQFPSDGSQPPTFEDPESVVIEADPFGRSLPSLNFQRSPSSGGFFRSSSNQRQQPTAQRSYSQNPPLNYFPGSSPTYPSLVENGLTQTSSSNAFLDRNHHSVNSYVTTPLPSQPHPIQNLLDQQRPRTHSSNYGYPASRSSNSHQQTGYSYQAPKIPFSLPGQEYTNSHVNLGVHQRLSTRASDFLVSDLNLNPRSGFYNQNANHNNYHANTYQSNGQLQNQRLGYSY